MYGELRKKANLQRRARKLQDGNRSKLWQNQCENKYSQKSLRAAMMQGKKNPSRAISTKFN